MKRLSLSLAAAFLVAHAAFASVIIFEVNFDGPYESPVAASTGAVFATVTIDDVLNTMDLTLTFSGLTGLTTTSQVQCCTVEPLVSNAGIEATTPIFAGFPLGFASGSCANLLDVALATSHNPAFVFAHGTTASTEAFCWLE